MNNANFFQTRYDLNTCEIGMVHIGYGAFHRAHQAVYFDDYMQKTGDLRWGIAAVNLRPSESAAFQKGADLQGGYLLKSIAPDGAQEFRTVRPHKTFIDAAQDVAAAVDIFARESVKIASMTVTESGYYLADDWSLDLTSPTIAQELAGGKAQTIYAFLARALAHRAATIGTPITVLCCDNMRNNGKILEQALQSYLRAKGQSDLAVWVQENVTFPCSMVDRITPRSSAALEEEIQRMFPALATSPIQAEAFSQWVLEDKFATDMPDLSKVGVEIVPCVEPYEEAKIRILNGGHTALAYLGALAGHATFDQAMRDPALRVYFDKWEQDEVLAGLKGVIPFDAPTYLSQIAARFENAGIADQLERICMDGYSKMGIYIRPTLQACLEQGILPKTGFDCVASWVVFARKAQAGGAKIPYHEPLWDRLEPLIGKGNETALASDSHLWGDLPKRFDGFVPSLVTAIQEMENKWQA